MEEKHLREDIVRMAEKLSFCHFCNIIIIFCVPFSIHTSGEIFRQKSTYQFTVFLLTRTSPPSSRRKIVISLFVLNWPFDLEDAKLKSTCDAFRLSIADRNVGPFVSDSRVPWSRR